MTTPSPAVGALGILPDQPDHELPLGAWADGRNLRFNDGYIERIKEPALRLAVPTDTVGLWIQLYHDGDFPRLVIAVNDTVGSVDKLYRLDLAGTAWEDVTPVGGLTEGGRWQSFKWGTAVVCNNGIEAPQILLTGGANFADLTNWGTLTSGQTVTTAAVLRPFRNFMLAIGLVIDGTRKPNALWISGPGVEDNDDTAFFQPSWDHEDPGTKSTFVYQGADVGPLVDMAQLNNQLILYTNASAYILQLVGGNNTWGFLPSIEYGLIGIGAVVPYKNHHFCIGPTTLYVHDGSVVRHIADGVIQTAFFDSLIDFDDITGVENLEFKEVQFLYNAKGGKREYLIYNYKDETFAIGDASVEGDDCAAMAYDIGGDEDGTETWATISTTWSTETRTWADLAGSSGKRSMFWLTAGGLYLAEAFNTQDSQKRYFVSRDKLDFSELNEKMTTNWWKEISAVYPHITGTAPTEITLGWSETVGETTINDLDTFSYDPATDYKADFRTSGRYIALAVDIVGDGAWRFSSMNYDLDVEYGR
jgi:hypothetical protein